MKTLESHCCEKQNELFNKAFFLHSRAGIERTARGTDVVHCTWTGAIATARPTAVDITGPATLSVCFLHSVFSVSLILLNTDFIIW